MNEKKLQPIHIIKRKNDTNRVIAKMFHTLT